MSDDELAIWDTIVSAEGETLPIHQTYRPPARGRHESVNALPEIAMTPQGETSGDLRVKRTLGQGGMGIVHLAEQIAVGRDVAVKTVRPDADFDAMTRRSLLQEAWMTGVLEHPNIVPIYTLGADEKGSPIIVMKRIEGVEWSELLRAPGPREEFGGRDPLVFHLQVLAQICLALQFAHSRGIVHRDVKPENVMIGSFGEVYLLDWGIAVSVGEDGDGRFPRSRDISQPAGTPAYMAPEMTTGEPGAVGTRTDVYLVGAVLHEIVTGRAPHDRGDLRASLLHAYLSAPPEYREDVPAELAELAAKAMARDPDDRWASIQVVRQRVLAYLDHRAAYAILEEATEQHREMIDAIEREDLEGIQEAFAAAKFGCEQALREWPEFEAASRQRIAVLIDMLRRELDQGNLSAASVHARELRDALPEQLAVRLDELRRRRASRDEEFERLKELEREVDSSRGRRGRSQVALFFAALWGGSPLVVDEVSRRGWAEVNYPNYLAQGVFVVLIFVLVLIVWRRVALENRANRRISYGLAVMLIGIVVHRIYAWLSDFALPEAIIAEFLIYGLGGATVALMSDIVLIWATFIYFGGALLAALYPASTLPILAICNIVVASLFAWAWRRPEGSDDD